MPAAPAPEPTTPALPAIGSMIHFRYGPLNIELGHAPCDCLHTLVARHEDAAAGEILVALRSPQGWYLHHNVKYAPLPACDVSGTWHPADEHPQED